MIVAVNAIYAIAKRSVKKKIPDFNGVFFIFKIMIVFPER